MKRVMKFGGTSVGDGERIERAASLVAAAVARGDLPLVVVSAMNDTTDDLLAACEHARRGRHDQAAQAVHRIATAHLDAVRRAVREGAVRDGLLSTTREQLGELEKVLTGIAFVGELTPRSRDFVLSFGERLSTPILAGALAARGLPARAFTGKEAGILTDSRFGEARPLVASTRHQLRERLGALVESGTIPVVTGFIAADQHGTPTTIGRGGSDFTATLLGAALEVGEIELWSDVDGLLSADPRVVPDARLLEELSYAEAMEMAFFGAKTMPPGALEMASEAGIPVRVRNCARPERTGTAIIEAQKVHAGSIVKTVLSIRKVGLVTVSGGGMAGVPGTAARVFDILGEARANVLMVSQGSSEVNITVVLPSDAMDRAVNALELGMLGGGAVREVVREDDVAIVACVGAGMKGTPGVAARVFTAVAGAGVNVHMIAQGSSELNISFVVREADADRAVRALHAEFVARDAKG
ncbi:MAG: aspartate kinase [Planctomycetes bacterium]|nr:aspartate kinase [Planctomycetota bacterium]